MLQTARMSEFITVDIAFCARLNFPVHATMARYDTGGYHDELFATEGILLPPPLRTAREKRKAEYLAGRYLAGMTLKNFGVRGFEVASDATRCPIWPHHLVGSISHTESLALCALAYKSELCALGVDVEHWFSQEMASNVMDRISDATERLIIESLDLSFDRALTILFSAKESLFKALFPSVRRGFYFKTAKLKGGDMTRGTLTFELKEDLGAGYHLGCELEARFWPMEHAVVTLVAVP